MSIEMNEILRENKEFYSNTYSMAFSKRIYNLVSGVYIIVCGMIAFFLKQQVFRSYYIRQASLQSLDGKEVMVWVQEMLANNRWDHYTYLIFGGVAVLLLFLRAINKFWKNYDLYKHRALLSLGPIIFVVFELSVLFIGLQMEAGLFTDGIVTAAKGFLLLLNFLPIVMTSRLFVTLEAREATETVWNIIDWISDKLLKAL